MKKLIPLESIRQCIYFVREQKVMLDSDLAKIYGVSTKRLNQQVHRNLRRFPADFMFRLTAIEAKSLRLQNATSKEKRGGRELERKYDAKFKVVFDAIRGLMKPSPKTPPPLQVRGFRKD